MAEDEARHLQNLRDQEAARRFAEIRRGQIMAFLLGVLGLSLAAYLGIKGHGVPAIGLALAGVSSMMSQFIRKR